MGKTFITDEVNDIYTAKVTTSGQLYVMPNHNSFWHVSAIACSSNAIVISSAPCWLHSVTIGSYPATATSIRLYNLAASATGYSVTGSLSGTTSSIGYIDLPVSADTSASSVNNQFPKTLIYDLYCSSGLSLAVSAGDIKPNNGLTITYRA